MPAILRMNRRQALATAMAMTAAVTSLQSHAAPAVLPSSVSLPDELARALKSGNPPGGDGEPGGLSILQGYPRKLSGSHALATRIASGAA